MKSLQLTAWHQPKVYRIKLTLSTCYFPLIDSEVLSSLNNLSERVLFQKCLSRSETISQKRSEFRHDTSWCHIHWIKTSPWQTTYFDPSSDQSWVNVTVDFDPAVWQGKIKRACKTFLAQTYVSPIIRLFGNTTYIRRCYSIFILDVISGCWWYLPYVISTLQWRTQRGAGVHHFGKTQIMKFVIHQKKWWVGVLYSPRYHSLDVGRHKPFV